MLSYYKKEGIMGKIGRGRPISFRKTVVIAALAGAILIPAMAVYCQTQEWSRDKSFGGSLFFGRMSGDDLHFIKSGADIGMNQMTFFGFEGGQNLNDFFRVNFSVFLGTTKFYRTHNPGLSLSSWPKGLELNAEFYFLRSRVTPLLSGGMGIIRFDNSISEYFLDMFEDRICFSFRWGAGFRFDFNGGFFVKVLYEAFQTKYPGTSGPLLFDGFCLHFGGGR
jgi:opacity protein-like surface antigen